MQVSERQPCSEQSGSARIPRRWILLLLACVLVAAMVGYAIGMAEQSRQFSTVEASNKALLEEVAELRDQKHQARLKLARLESDRAVDTQAMKEARKAIVALETRVSELESDLGFYRNIMSPSETEKGFQLDRFVLTPTDQERVFEYALVAIQAGDNERFLSGRLVITISGAQDGGPLELRLHDVSKDVDNEGIEYRFRYFQDVEGRVVLPEGFQPEEVRVVARGRRTSEPVLEEVWNWEDLLVRESPNS